MKILISILILVTNLLASSEYQIKTTVSKVEVSQENATVYRTGVVNLNKGQYKLVINNLPPDLIEETMQVQVGGKDVTILEVLIEDVYIGQQDSQDEVAVKIKIDSLKYELKRINNNNEILSRKEEFLGTIKLGTNKESSTSLLSGNGSIKKLSSVVKFIEDNYSSIYQNKLNNITKIEAIENRINELNNEINTLQKVSIKRSKQVTISIDNNSIGQIRIDLSYLTNRAKWYPVYDVKLLDDETKVELKFNAMIKQSTGEDWESVDIKLSTNNPLKYGGLQNLEKWILDINQFEFSRINKNHSEVSSASLKFIERNNLPIGKTHIEGYVIDFKTGDPLFGANVIIGNTTYGAATDLNGKFTIKNVPVGNYNLEARYIGYKNSVIKLHLDDNHLAQCDFKLAPELIKGETVVITSQAAGQISKVNKPAKVEEISMAQEINATYSIDTKTSIPSDNNFHKYFISKNICDTKLEYITIPKKEEAVYINSSITNSNQLLLEGMANLFQGKKYLNRTNLSQTLPKDTIKIDFGKSQNIKVARKLINKKIEKKGLFNNSKLITYEYEITLENRSNFDKKIKVKDQIPYSAHEDISIELIQPTDLLNKEDNSVTWDINLPPNGKKELLLKFTVEHPSNKIIFGLQ